MTTPSQCPPGAPTSWSSPTASRCGAWSRTASGSGRPARAAWSPRSCPCSATRDGLWIGWAGNAGDGQSPPREHEGIALRDVAITEDEYDDFDLGFSNATLWPLYHDAIRPAIYDRSWWHVYRSVNEASPTPRPKARRRARTVWVQDYQLQLVPKLLRERRPDLGIGFFLHIPFPPRELFLQLPWRREILEGRGADLVGFQVVGGGDQLHPSGPAARGRERGVAARSTSMAGRVHVGTFPISVDNTYLRGTRRAIPTIQARARTLRTELGDPELLLGVDRLDYTKGIDRRIRAVGELFDEGALDLAGHVVVQIAVPSRAEDAHTSASATQLE